MRTQEIYRNYQLEIDVTSKIKQETIPNDGIVQQKLSKSFRTTIMG